MMRRGRLEAFSDGVLAILITIMVLEIKVPHEPSLAALRPLLSVLLSYALSFIYLGIYWNNHHHLLHAANRVTGGILWANLHLLFWLSLVPFATHWMGETRFAPAPTAVYGLVFLLAAFAYWILQGRILASEGCDSALAAALGRDLKGKISQALYLIAVLVALVQPWIAWAVYVGVAFMWLVPDRRIARALAADDGGARGG